MRAGLVKTMGRPGILAPGLVPIKGGPGCLAGFGTNEKRARDIGAGEQGLGSSRAEPRKTCGFPGSLRSSNVQRIIGSSKLGR